MAQKFYARKPFHWMAVSDMEGDLSGTDLLWNIMRMMVMSEEDVNSREAFKILDEMPQEQFDELKRNAESWLYDPEMQAYLERKNVKEGDRMYPVEDEEELMSNLDEMDWESFLSGELPEAEWD